MSDIRLHNPSKLDHEHLIELNEKQSHYVSRVMRKNIGDSVFLFNEHHGQWCGVIEDSSKKLVTIRLHSQVKPPVLADKNTFKMGLVFAPVKNASPHFIASKATELGVDVIQPVITERTIVRKMSSDKLLSNAIEASEQCERLSVPKVHDAMTLDRFIENYPKDRVLIFCDESGGGTSLKKTLEILNTSSDLHIDALVGPEGGFTENERHKIYQLEQSIAVGMGTRIMKADTSMIAILSAIQLMLDGWNAQPRFIYN